MSKYIKKADREHAPYGPLAKHGGYSVARKDELVRRHPEIQLYLKIIRRDLIRDLSPEGEEHLTAARRLILDRLMQKVATVRLIEIWLAENPSAILAAASVTGLWLSINTGILKDLLALGLDRRAIDVTPLSPAELMAEVVEDERLEAEKAAKDEPSRVQEPRSEADQASGQGEDDIPLGGER